MNKGMQLTTEMTTKVIDERDFVSEFKRDNLEDFQRFVKQYDAFQAPVLRSQGWKHVNTKKRTVVFTLRETRQAIS
ncbi:hypothetical protein GYN14_04140 [Lactococcus piscium]|uniref:hypothetical protein n=1 Tax=Pseudolactococcus carnosus TaxID=2749961 RepID=UPI001FB8A335|nr:hypothetical protein [Lactococcus carnosus]MCJ1991686.1 hypothetical protein [Lactococcus carnosus]